MQSNHEPLRMLWSIAWRSSIADDVRDLPNSISNAQTRPLDFLSPFLGKNGGKVRGAERSSRMNRRRGMPRKKSSGRDAIILAAPCSSRFFWIASRSQRNALSPRAPALITRYRGYYRGNAKRPSSREPSPAPCLFSSLAPSL